MVKTCDYCGASFNADAYEHKRGRAKYCSPGCGHAGRVGKGNRRSRAARLTGSARYAAARLVVAAKSMPVPEAGCWLWLGDVSNRGYPLAKFQGRGLTAHRLSWSSANESEIPNGLVVMHKCDTPTCVNPEHLQLGTLRENTLDAIRKGRMHGKPSGQQLRRTP